MTEYKFKECSTCINREFDPFQCQTCKNGSNYEVNDLDPNEYVEEMTYQEFLALLRTGE